MTQKNLLTISHSVLAIIVTPIGMAGAATIAGERPIGALVISCLAIVLPTLIATRIAWASGYAAGREETKDSR